MEPLGVGVAEESLMGLDLQKHWAKNKNEV